MQRVFFLLVLTAIIGCAGGKQITENTEDGIATNRSTKTKSIVVPVSVEQIKEKALVIENPETAHKKDSVISDKPKEIFTQVELDTLPKNKEIFDHNAWDELLQKHVTKDGIVNYVHFKKDKALLKSYLLALSENMPDDTWSKADILAYWMNAYNAFTIKLIIDNYPVKSIKDIKSPWDIRFFKLGKKWYNLNEIEHQILRKMEEPRIHFGINCASFSCPPLLNQAFTSKNVYQQLENLTRSFINDPLRNSLSSDRVELSKIFSWFAKDFKTKGTLIDFLNTYANIQIHPKAKKVFLEYDWRLNEM